MTSWKTSRCKRSSLYLIIKYILRIISGLDCYVRKCNVILSEFVVRWCRNQKHSEFHCNFQLGRVNSSGKYSNILLEHDISFKDCRAAENELWSEGATVKGDLYRAQRVLQLNHEEEEEGRERFTGTLGNLQRATGPQKAIQ